MTDHAVNLSLNPHPRGHAAPCEINDPISSRRVFLKHAFGVSALTTFSPSLTKNIYGASLPSSHNVSLLTPPDKGYTGTIRVNSVSSLQQAVNNAKPGNRIIVANGVYKTTESVLVKNAGTASEPITIEAETTGGVEITGASGFGLSAPSAYIVIKGFKFTHESGANHIEPGVTRCLITRNIYECKPVGRKVRPYLGISGDDNEICYNTFQNKMDRGPMLIVSGPTRYKIAKRTWIHHNYFYNFPRIGGGQCSAVHLGYSGRSLDPSFTLVEHNLFAKTEGGHHGSTCLKASNYIIRFNTFGEQAGEMSMRHGNNSQVYGNFFFNNLGLRFVGDDHLIYNNYFYRCLRAIRCQNGSGEIEEGLTLLNTALLQTHDRPDRVMVVYNTIIDCDISYRMPPNQMPQVDEGLGATKITFANNIIQGGKPVSIDGIYKDPVWKSNIIWNTTGGSMPSGSYKVVNPRFIKDDNGIYILSPDSPAIGAGTGNYPFVTTDIFGNPRGATPDIGAHQLIPAPYKPLSASDVGPDAA